MAKRRGRAAKGEGCIRKRNDGRWEYIYTDKAGELKHAYAHSEAEIVEKKKAIQSALYEGTYVDPSAHTVSTWADYFFAELYLQQNNNTRACVYNHIKNHIKPFFKEMKLQDASKEDVQRFHKRLIDKGLATHTIQNVQATLVQVFQSAIPKRIRQNPATGIRVEKGVKPEMLYFDTEGYLDFLRAVENLKLCSRIDCLFLKMALDCGMREGEIIGMDWSHINFATGTINIHQQLKRLKSYGGKKELPSKKYYIKVIDANHYLALPKHDKKRYIKPGKHVMEMLKEIKALQIAERLRTGLGDAYNPHGFVFVNEIGEHLIATTVLAHFRKVLSAIGAPPEMRIHDLRHTYVYNALQSGLTYDQISENLGHKSVDFTKRQYGHFPDTLHEDSAAKMDAFHERMRQKQAEITQKEDRAT